MKTIKLTLEYDGTDLSGWQIQPNGLTVQQLLEEALAKVLGEAVRLHSSGRTDAGVHARGMVAHFRTRRELPVKAYREGLNGLLPPSVCVLSAHEESESFHARFSARGKWYRYTICNRPVRSPLLRNRSWHIRSPLDAAVMEVAARQFVGEHNFAAFRTTGCAAQETVRTIFSVELHRVDELLHIDVRGSGFLRNMVRIMVGTLVDIGLGKRPPEDVAELLKQAVPGSAGLTAPPQGLCLMEVWY